MKTVYLLNISQEPGGYAPEITAITRPWIDRWAAKIGAEVFTIRERRFPAWDLDYEKLQIHDLARERGDDWSIYLDSDALVHPELPDITELLPRDTVAHNGSDFAPIRWKYDEYFRRDGRHVGSCNWLAVASSWCLDLWRPLDDLTPEQAVANITPTAEESRPPEPGEPKVVVSAAHLVSDYALSRNIARFGLKFTTLGKLWQSHGMTPDFFSHTYTTTHAEKVRLLTETLKRWRL